MIRLIGATDADRDFVRELRNRPEVAAGSWSQTHGRDKPRSLTRSEHRRWWCTHRHWGRFIIVVKGRRVGAVMVSGLDLWCPEIGIYLMPEEWGRGTGSHALVLALCWIRWVGHYERVHATILANNVRSVALFRHWGFRCLGEAREGEWLFDLRLARLDSLPLRGIMGGRGGRGGRTLGNRPSIPTSESAWVESPYPASWVESSYQASKDD